MFNKNENEIKVYNKKVFYDTNGNYTIYWILWKTNENYELQISNKSYKILLENYTIQMKYKWKNAYDTNKKMFRMPCISMKNN